MKLDPPDFSLMSDEAYDMSELLITRSFLDAICKYTSVTQVELDQFINSGSDQIRLISPEGILISGRECVEDFTIRFWYPLAQFSEDENSKKPLDLRYRDFDIGDATFFAFKDLQERVTTEFLFFSFAYQQFPPSRNFFIDGHANPGCEHLKVVIEFRKAIKPQEQSLEEMFADLNQLVRVEQATSKGRYVTLSIGLEPLESQLFYRLVCAVVDTAYKAGTALEVKING
ncbi:MAG: hypothetical protein R3C11_00970 [Planctomycetaceae bacterium]